MTVCNECGQNIPEKRSLEQNNLFHYLMLKAFQNWPEFSKFQPRDKEHLRAYLLVKAGHSNIHHVALPDEISPGAITMIAYGVLQSMGKDAFIKAQSTGFEMAVPKSISFDKCKPPVFRQVMDDVLEIIETDYIPGFRREFLPPDIKGLYPEVFKTQSK